MTAKDNTIKMSLDELRKRIAKLTGRIPVSDDERYLARTLEELLTRKKNGEDVSSSWGNEPSEPVTFSMPRRARDGVRKLADKQHVSASEIVRKALAVYAESIGEKTLATKAFDAGAES